MESSMNVMIVEDSLLAGKMLQDYLSQKGLLVNLVTSGQEALARLLSGADIPRLIISDVMMPGMSGYELCRAVRQNEVLHHIPFILLTARDGLTEKITGFEAGADDYLVKPVQPEELLLRIKALLARATPQNGQSMSSTDPCRTISVFSLRGGAGVTSLALNLALGLKQLWSEPVPLLDLGLHSGHCALMLNLKPESTLTDLARRDEESIDEMAIQRTFLRHKSGIRLLAAPNSIIDTELINRQLLSHIWPTITTGTKHLVIDAGRSFNDAALTALDFSDVIILVVTPELAGLKAASDALQTFESLEYRDKQIHLAVNWIFPREGLTQRQIESSLRVKVSTTIPHERDLFLRSVNTGHPLLLSAPKSQVSQAILQLAETISAPALRVDRAIRAA